jgi:chromosome segregation ATPase
MQLGSQEVDDLLMKRVKTIINDVKDKTEALFQEQYNNEQNSIASYNEDKSRIEVVVKNLEDNQSNLEQEIAALNKCIVTQ